jgi:hypothetical protein
MTIQVEKVTILDRLYLGINIDGVTFVQRTSHQQGIEEPLSPSEKVLVAVCLFLCENMGYGENLEKKIEKPILTETEEKFMCRFGWEETEDGWVKLDEQRRPVARFPSDTWGIDLKAARE